MDIHTFSHRAQQECIDDCLSTCRVEVMNMLDINTMEDYKNEGNLYPKLT